MKRDLRLIQDDEIDLREIIKTFWNEKILILSISLIFMVAGYVYGALQPKIYKTEITLREAPSYFLKPYGFNFISQSEKDIAKNFNNEVKLILSSFDTLVQFVENNNTTNNPKNYLKEKNISFDFKNNILNKYSLTYSQPLSGEAFLNDYIIFAHQQAVNSLKQELTQIIISEINNHQNHLEIANKINLENPILQTIKTVDDEPDPLFYKGTKVLTQQIIYLNMSLNKIKNLRLDYNPILQQPLRGSLITESPIIYAVITFLLGLFFSLMIVFIRSIVRR